MAGIQYRNGSYRILFRYQEKQHAFTLGEVSKSEAETKAAQVDYLLLRLKQRLANIPPSMGIVDYVQFDGKQSESNPTNLNLAQFRDRYLSINKVSLESNTLSSIRTHFLHLTNCLGESFPIAQLSLADLQQYVDHRTKATGTKGRKLSAVTIRKEIVTLRTAWNWGIRMKLVTGPYPYAGLRYPKTTEKPPFQTLAEIERRLHRSPESET